MTDQEAKKFTNDIFGLIEESKTILDLESIPDKLEIPTKNRMNVDGYPKIEFNISQKEIQSLRDNKIIDDDLNFKADNPEVETLRKLETLDKTHKPIIKKYKTWLISDNLHQELRTEKDYTYYIDKLLFATGKTIKFRKPRKEKSTGANRP